MFEWDRPQKNPLFSYYAPLGKFRGIISVPHSGETIPDDMKPFLTKDKRANLEDVDYKTNELFDIEKMQQNGVAVLVAHIQRTAVDLNRDSENCILFWKQNTQGIKLVEKTPSEQEKKFFRDTYYSPYYEMLSGLINHLERFQNPAPVIDFHSMPSKPTPYHMKQNPNQDLERPEICLSDRRNHTTCRPEYIDRIQEKLAAKGYKTTQNDPYIGGYLTEFINKFKTDNIQIEINRKLYMDEEKKILIENSKKLNEDLTEVFIDHFKYFSN